MRVFENQRLSLLGAELGSARPWLLPLPKQERVFT
jgi:hypothetical protein